MGDNSIGGFLDFELRSLYKKEQYHSDAIGFSCGRACFAALIKHLTPKKIYLPFYTCNSLLDVLTTLDIHYQFYAIDEQLRPIGKFSIDDKSIFLYINYFGICSETTLELEKLYKEKLIIDNTMSFFSKKYIHSHSFNSCRKFFGVSDGAYLMTNEKIAAPKVRVSTTSSEHLISRMLGHENKYYNQYLKNENNFDCNKFGISLFAQTILSCIDYQAVATKRRLNFKFYHSKLSQYNRLKHFKLSKNEVPQYYPLLLNHTFDKSLLISNKIFVPSLWEDVINRQEPGYQYERSLSKNILLLPIDQRYKPSDLRKVEKLILKNI